jgi:hypothetical protein
VQNLRRGNYGIATEALSGSTQSPSMTSHPPSDQRSIQIMLHVVHRWRNATVARMLGLQQRSPAFPAIFAKHG